MIFFKIPFILRLVVIHPPRQQDERVYTGLARQPTMPQPPTELASALKALSSNLHRDSRRCSSCRRQSRSAAVRRPIPANRHVMISDPKCLETYTHTHTPKHTVNFTHLHVIVQDSVCVFLLSMSSFIYFGKNGNKYYIFGYCNTKVVLYN